MKTSSTAVNRSDQVTGLASSSYTVHLLDHHRLCCFIRSWSGQHFCLSKPDVWMCFEALGKERPSPTMLNSNSASSQCPFNARSTDSVAHMRHTFWAVSVSKCWEVHRLCCASIIGSIFHLMTRRPCINYRMLTPCSNQVVAIRHLHWHHLDISIFSIPPNIYINILYYS